MWVQCIGLALRSCDTWELFPSEPLHRRRGVCARWGLVGNEKNTWSLQTPWELNKLRLCLSFPHWPVALGASSGACSAGLPLRFKQHLFYVTLLGGRGDLVLASVLTCALRGSATEMELNPGSWKSIQWWRFNITDMHSLGLHLKMASEHRKDT